MHTPSAALVAVERNLGGALLSQSEDPPQENMSLLREWEYF